MADATQETPQDEGTEQDFAAFEAQARAQDEQEAPKPEETAPPEPEEPEDDADDTEDEDDGEEEEQEAAEEQPRRRNKTSARERIAEITRKYHEEKRAREELEARYAGQNRPQEQPREEPAQPKPAEKPAEGETTGPKPPDPDDFDFGEVDPKYVEALVDYRYELNEQEREARLAVARQQQEIQQRQQTIYSRFEEQAKTGAEKHPDYVDVVLKGAHEDKWALSEHLAPLIAESDVGHEIAYHLATHPEESFEVYRSSPVEQARYFGRLEARFSAAESAAPGGNRPAEQAPPAKTPKAPPPVAPARGSGGKFQATAASEDFAAFERSVNGR